MTATVAADRRRRFRLRLLVGFLVLLCLAYAKQFATSPSVGQDFRAFFAGATLLRQGGDPYDWSQLGATEVALYNAPDHLAPGDPRFYDFHPLAEGPWLFLALAPLAGWPWRLAYGVWACVIVVLVTTGARLILRQVGFRHRGLHLALVVTLLSPIAFLGLFFGQATQLIFATFAIGWALAARGRPTLAGVILAATWVKPNVGIVVPLVVALLVPRSTRQLAGGYATGSLVAFAVALAALGGRLVDWPAAILGFWRSNQGPQPDIASLHSFYYPLLAGWPRTVVFGLALAAVGAYSVWSWRRLGHGSAVGLTALLLWIGGLPFVHSYDLLILLPVVAVLVGPSLSGLADPWVETTLWAFLLLPLLYFVGLHLGPFNGFSAIPVALTAWAWHRRIVAPSRAPLEMAA